MKIGGAYRKHEFLTGARFFMKQLHAYKNYALRIFQFVSDGPNENFLAYTLANSTVHFDLII